MLWLLRRATALFSTRMRERTLSVYKDVHRRERLPFDDADRRCVTTCGPVCAPARGAGAGRTRLPLRPCPVQLARRRAGLTVYITHLTLNAGACSRDLCAPSGRTLEFSASGEDENRDPLRNAPWRGRAVVMAWSRSRARTGFAAQLAPSPKVSRSRGRAQPRAQWKRRSRAAAPCASIQVGGAALGPLR